MKAKIILKNGIDVDFKCTSLSTKRNGLTGELTSIEWKGAENIQINYICLEDISAVICIKDE